MGRAKQFLKTASQSEDATHSIAQLAPEELLLLDPSVIDRLDWSDFSKFDSSQLVALGELQQKKLVQKPSNFCYTIPPFILGPLPQKGFDKNHFSRQFRWQEIHYTNSIGEPLPAGSPARVLLLHIVTSIIQNQDPVVDLKESITDFIRFFGLTPSYGEKGSVAKYESALKSLMHTIVELRSKRKGEGGLQTIEEIRFPIFKRDAMTINDSGLISGKARIDDEFARIVFDSKVVLNKEAVIKLAKSRSPAALDIYMWSTYTNFYLSKNPRPNIHLSWDEAYELFSNREISKKAFKRDFQIKVKLVEEVYPKLRLIVAPEKITLWQSPAHVTHISSKK